VDFRILGPLEVTQDGRSLALGGAQQRALLAVLLIHRGEVLSTDRLIDELWGERAPSSAVKVVQGYISQLRKALGDDVIVTRGHGYLLAVESERVDACRFEALVAGGQSAFTAGDAASAHRRLGEALALWRGEPLADFAYERFAQGEIARLGQARFAALEDRIDVRLALGEHARLVAQLEALVRENPSRERLVGQLMVALYRSGRQADALESYRVARRQLVDELGLEPGRELQELERAILAQDPALDAPARDTARKLSATARPARRGGLVIAAGAAVLLAVLIAAAVRLAGSGTSSTMRVAPNSLAAIDTDTNRVVGQVAVGTRPGAIAFGSGSLWVANLDDQTISRVDPKTLSPLRAITAGGPPTGIAAAAGGVWVVVSNAAAPSVSVRRIDPQFDRIGQKVTIDTVVPGSPGAVAAQGDALWVAPYSGDLTRLAAQTGRIVEHVDPNAAPGGIDVGAGAAWMTDSFAGNVIRVDDATGLVTPLAVGPGPSGIAVGGGGVWVAVRGADKVVRIDPGTRAVTDTIAVGRSPTGVSFGAGSVWVANSGDGTVTRIDPTTNQPNATIAVGGSPHATTIAGGRAWVTVDAQTLGAGGRAGEGGTARLAAYYDPVDLSSLDPAVAYEPLLAQMLYATCAKLLNYPDKAGLAGSQLVPEVAQSLPARSADGKTYTFTIRSGFRFSPPSTERVTAQTFKHAIERTLNPAMKSPAASGAADIVGAGAYMAGKAAHIAGVTARANTLTIRLTDPAPNLPTRLAQPFFCAVPSNTPPDPQVDGVIPSAGPYRVASYTPKQGVVLTRNPNYHGSRPHRLARIELAVEIPGHRAIAQVEAGTADYALNGAVDSTNAATLDARYGPHSPAAKSGHQQYFVNPQSAFDYFALNTHRPLFADARMRQAFNYAIDRAALARLGDPYFPLPGVPTDHYLPPGVPGHVDGHIYPFTPDLTKARRLAKGHAGATAVLYTSDLPAFTEQAQIIKNDLAAIGVRVVVKAFPNAKLGARLATPGEPFDISYGGWAADYPDPQGVLDPLLQNNSNLPSLDDPSRAKLRAAARLRGPERYLAYARLDRDLARNAAPLAVYDNPSSHELFSARMGCQTYGVYGIDLAALCIKRAAR
jgi:YVTN family beta-propeller protein